LLLTSSLVISVLKEHIPSKLGLARPTSYMRHQNAVQAQLLMLRFNIGFSYYGATIVLELSLRSLHSTEHTTSWRAIRLLRLFDLFKLVT